MVGLMTVDWLEEGRFLLWEAVGRVVGFGLVMESRMEVWDAISSSSARREGDQDVVMDISEDCGILSCVGEINCEVLGGAGRGEWSGMDWWCVGWVQCWGGHVWG